MCKENKEKVDFVKGWSNLWSTHPLTEPQNRKGKHYFLVEGYCCAVLVEVKYVLLRIFVGPKIPRNVVYWTKSLSCGCQLRRAARSRSSCFETWVSTNRFTNPLRLVYAGKIVIMGDRETEWCHECRKTNWKTSDIIIWGASVNYLTLQGLLCCDVSTRISTFMWYKTTNRKRVNLLSSSFSCSLIFIEKEWPSKFFRF